MRTCLRGVGRAHSRAQRLHRGHTLSAPLTGTGAGNRYVASKAMTETSVFLEEIAVSQTPKRLQGLMRVLEVQGGVSLSPADRRGLHPLLVPLSAQGEDVTCLLRWPEPSQNKNMPLPVVRMTRGSVGMTLVARSVDEYLHRLLAEEDVTASASESGAAADRPLAAAVGTDADGLYRTGDVAAAGLGGGRAGGAATAGQQQQPGPGLAMYLIRKAGMFPDVCEGLAFGHLGRKDQTSAMVASEWYMRNNHFPGWARPYEFASELFGTLGRHEEARDFARMSLRLPWWTLRAPFATVATTAALPVDAERVMYLLSEEAAAAASATVNRFNYKEPKSAKQLALERATALMNRVVAGDLESYDAIREPLAEAYLEAGLNDVANFIQAA
ncbi:hypothetical protein PLESTB_000988700 [Pleodorina starrii]|uniref:Uncharacterized protein n=1 Tax=Pleodorina starrii TaxID=330485 RepID=A0A9W6F3V1_9CHLO|nr:hypothetical protein PLESTM_000551300 [Pleodorina starrii]GLC55452.1 hypothetical protein PLESTB_000988700 [Pleodorina starrii]GLC73845.1 hypothetical protein PLESTF_001427100 [Pleodorina starrii]